MFKKIIIIIPITIIVLLYAEIKIREMVFESDITNRIEEALKNTSDMNGRDPDDNYIESLFDRFRFTEGQLHLNLIQRPRKETSSGVAYWSFNNNKSVTASAFGTDYLHHFVNHYLIGYAPFHVDNLWMPHFIISMRLTYQLDAEQYGGLAEVWQNSKQAFVNTRGDCEDHAIALTDWLIELGLDARVVLGSYKSEGHAWVIVVMESGVFLLESTDKQKNTNWHHYPLAKFEHNYHPKAMFNREYFWFNTGSVYTTSYQGNHWVKKSRFYRLNGEGK